MQLRIPAQEEIMQLHIPAHEEIMLLGMPAQEENMLLGMQLLDLYAGGRFTHKQIMRGSVRQNGTDTGMQMGTGTQHGRELTVGMQIDQRYVNQPPVCNIDIN